jgi:hypothetical protein
MGEWGVGGWAAAGVARWPKFWPKSSKGAGEKKVGRKNLWPKIDQTFSIIGQTFFMYWPENNFGTWQHWQQHTYTWQKLSTVCFISQIKDDLCLTF